MRKFIIFGYRDWSHSVYEKLVEWYDFEYVSDKDNCTVEYLREKSPDMVFFVGWSWIVPKEVLNEFMCLCIHPSPLPKYRGGSPIQNQVINGEEKSAVTLFIMNQDIDSGNVVKQEEISLEGYLNDVLQRIIDVSIKSISNAIQDKDWLGCLFIKEQNEEEATYYPRRKPSQSELRPIDLTEYSAKQIYDMVRCLQPPYPEVSIKCKEGRLILERVRYEL